MKDEGCPVWEVDAATEHPSSFILHPLVDGYLRRLQAERNPSPFTLRNYRTDLEHYFRWLEADGTAPSEVDRHTFRRYRAALDGARVARASVARKVSTIHTFYR